MTNLGVNCVVVVKIDRKAAIPTFVRRSHLIPHFMARFALISLLVIAIATAALADSCSRYNSCGTCTAVPDCTFCCSACRFFVEPPLAWVSFSLDDWSVFLKDE